MPMPRPNTTSMGFAGVVQEFLRSESGATAIEYALIAGLISIAIIVGVTSLGDQIGAIYNDLPLRFN